MMTGRWIANVAMLCPVEHLDGACIVASALSKNPHDAVPEFFSRKIGPIGSEEITHHLSHSRIRDYVLDELNGLKTIFPGAEYIITSHDDYPEEPNLSVEQWLWIIDLEFKDVEDVEEE